MKRKQKNLLAPIVEGQGFELVDVEYVKEAGNWYLRGYIDKPGGITVNDCEAVSRAFSDKLDENDFIEDSYIMEISSPGLGQTTEERTKILREAWENWWKSVPIVQSRSRKNSAGF